MSNGRLPFSTLAMNRERLINPHSLQQNSPWFEIEIGQVVRSVIPTEIPKKYRYRTIPKSRQKSSVGNTEGNTEKIPIPKKYRKILPVFFGFLKICF
jgi:hypothetical protein